MLIAIPIWDTDENRRSELTERVVARLLTTLRPEDRVIISDNGSCDETLEFYKTLPDSVRVIYNGRNLGIAGAVNVAWREAAPDEIVCKMDNDCLIHPYEHSWPQMVETVFEKNPDVGILGLKRKDVAEQPDAVEPHYRSRMFYANHQPSEPWIVLEQVNHVMGTCYCFNPKMRREFGYLMQPNSLYGFDDALAAVRAKRLGYKACFLPQIEIDHLDVTGFTSTDPYTNWKLQQAGRKMGEYNRLISGILRGEISAYYDGGF